jgi:LacI family transcriptional regulator
MCDSEPRWLGIQRVAAQAGIALDPRLVFELPGLSDPASGFEGGCRIVKQMLKTGKRFTAVLAFDDLTALGVLRGLTEAGIRVPEDCSVMGFDDVLPAKVATPAITTIRQPLNEMGVQAAEHVLRAIKKGDSSDKGKPLLRKAAPELVPRTSTAQSGDPSSARSRGAKRRT